MAEKLDPKALVLIEGLVVSHMFEIAALVELLEHKGVLTRKLQRQLIFDRKNRPLV